MRYEGDRLRHLAVPLGGLGTGSVALCGDGSLRQWQLFNSIDHTACLPFSGFAIRACSFNPPSAATRLLQSTAPHDDDTTPFVNDNFVPEEQRAWLRHAKGVDHTVVDTAYPFVTVAYRDAELGVDIDLEAYTPFAPLRSRDSGLPLVVFSFTVRNTSPHTVHGCLGGSLQNAVGWDGVTRVDGTRSPLYGGNTNAVRRTADSVAVVMKRTNQDHSDPSYGEMALAALDPDARPYPRWTDPAHFLRFMEGTSIQEAEPLGTEALRVARRASRNWPLDPPDPSPPGTTWNGGLTAPFYLAPAESAHVTFVLAWYFPNRVVNWDDLGPPRQSEPASQWIGNAYAEAFPDVLAVLDEFVGRRSELESVSRAWTEATAFAGLPGWLGEGLSAQAATLRSPLCLWTADGKFYGFEGGNGASTAHHAATYGGSCPLNCTHVWNYEQALARLFPDLERTMRETELEVLQRPDGSVPHRVRLPIDSEQFEGILIGPVKPALDGMLGTVLKTYRETRQGAGREWLLAMWPRIKALVDYVESTWNAEGDGILRGEQPNTYDIAFSGPNVYIGALWLAGLRAAEEMAVLCGDERDARKLAGLFTKASPAYDALLWNGEYYEQDLSGDATAGFHQYGSGCLSDQLLGQWWAHQLDLGYVLPPEHVRGALRSIVTYNFRSSFVGIDHDWRVFADGDDAGLVLCTWPRGGRPDEPMWYCDEVWTGVEYQVAAHCLYEGMWDQGFLLLEALHARYDGRKRNPFNHVECGDHYARSLAGWSVVDALTGWRYNAETRSLKIGPAGSLDRFDVPWAASAGWGSLSIETGPSCRRLELATAFGSLRLDSIEIVGLGTPRRVLVDGSELEVSFAESSGRSTVKFVSTVELASASTLVVETSVI